MANARSRGITKTHLQHVFTAVTLNLNRSSQIERLAYALAA
jgi:hypothetical protein